MGTYNWRNENFNLTTTKKLKLRQIKNIILHVSIAHAFYIKAQDWKLQAKKAHYSILRLRNRRDFAIKINHVIRSFILLSIRTII